MLAIAVILSAYVLLGCVLFLMIRAWGQTEPTFWQPLCILGGAKLASRSVAWLPTLTPGQLFSVGFVVYLVVIAGLLIMWCRVPAGRAIAVAAGVSIAMFAAAVGAAMLLPTSPSAVP